MIARLTSKAPDPADVAAPGSERFDVEFSRSAGRYRVVLRTSGARAGVRTLTDAGATCASLADATALTIAVIVDPEGVKLDEPAAASDPPPQVALPAAVAPSTDAQPPDVGAAPRGPAWALAVDARGGVAVGILRALAPVGVLAIELRPLRLVSVELGALFGPTQSLALERGTVDVSLLAGMASACLWPYEGAVRIGGCLGLAAGAIRAEGRGYPVASEASRPWLAAVAAVGAGGAIAWRLWWTGRVGAVVPTRRESFGIEGAGVAYEAPTVGALVTAGVGVSIR